MIFVRLYQGYVVNELQLNDLVAKVTAADARRRPLKGLIGNATTFCAEFR